MSLCLFKLYAEHIMRRAGLDGLQAGIKVERRNINNLRYADDTTIMAESKKELMNLLMRVRKEHERAGSRLNIFLKIKIMASSPITSWQIEGEEVEAVTELLFFGSESLQTVTAAMKSEDNCFLAGK